MNISFRGRDYRLGEPLQRAPVEFGPWPEDHFNTPQNEPLLLKQDFLPTGTSEELWDHGHRIPSYPEIKKQEAFATGGNVCTPVSMDGIVLSPVMDPYPSGTLITASIVNLYGTRPISFSWQIPGGITLTSTDEVFIFTLTDSQIGNGSPGDIRPWFIRLDISNACGEATTGFLSFNGQRAP